MVYTKDNTIDTGGHCFKLVIDKKIVVCPKIQAKSKLKMFIYNFSHKYMYLSWKNKQY